MIATVAASLLLTQSSTVTDDRDVIRTVLLSFFKHEKWYSPDWKPKDFVVLRPTYADKSRLDFGVAITNMETLVQSDLDWAKANPKKVTRGFVEEAKQKLGVLLYVQKESMSGMGLTLGKAVPLTKLQWGKKIVVSDEYGRKFGKGSSALAAQAYMPSYSRNGRYAIVRLTVPWSIHSSSITYLLARDRNQWQQLLVTPVFFT